MKASLIDGSDFDKMGIASSHDASDPMDDKELVAHALSNGATHISVETGHYYKVGADCEVSFFKRESNGSIRQIPSTYEAFEIDQGGFTPFMDGGSSAERALRAIANYWKITGPHFGAIVLSGMTGTGKSWISSELNSRGMKNYESYSLYGYGHNDAKKAMAVIKEEMAFHDWELGHLVFSVPCKELALAIDGLIQVFYIDGSPMKSIKSSLSQ